MPAISPTNLLALPSQPAKSMGFVFAPPGTEQFAFCFRRKKAFSSINARIGKLSTSATSPPTGRKDVVPMASQPVWCTAKQTKEEGGGMDPAGLRDKFKYPRLRNKLLHLRRAPRNWNTSSHFCYKKASLWGLGKLNSINTIKISLPHKAALNVFTIINLHCHLSCSGIQCKTKRTFS